SRRALPALLEMLLPVLRPRPAEKIDEALVERRELRRPAVGPEHDAALDAALDERVAPFRVVDAAGPRPRRDDAQRPRERLGVVEDRLDDQAFAVLGAADDLDHLELVAELHHRVAQRPALHVRGPRDQGVAVPKADRLAVPLRNERGMLLP